MDSILILLYMFSLLVAFQVKHFVADYILQFKSPYAMDKFKAKGWFRGLLLHALDHAILTVGIPDHCDGYQ